MTELLAPAGSMEALCAAIHAGADAVYLGGKSFGARHYAANFNDDEIQEAIRMAHLYNVSVYVTVNTLVDNQEMGALSEYVQQLRNWNADALIVQDLGVARVARKVAPDLPLHASTQMTVHNLEGVNRLHRMGFKRVVLARELSLQDIGEICSRTEAEIEMFVHGALCISYSGQCLMSSMIGGRSGNRGKCAQPCRLPYSLENGAGHKIMLPDTGEYLLSPKDLNTLAILPEVMASGITSLKIEGRMKRPEYVAVVVDAYRKGLDRCRDLKEDYRENQQDRQNVTQIFNRGFTDAYLTASIGKEMMSDRRPNNRGTLIGRVTGFVSGQKMVKVLLDQGIHVGDILEFWVKVGGRKAVTVEEIRKNGNLVTEAFAGEEVELPVTQAVKMNDRVFKTFDIQLTEKARSFFALSADGPKISVRGKVTVKEGQPFQLELKDADGFVGAAQSEFIVQQALNRPLQEDTLYKQIGRLGTSIFALEHLDCQLQNQMMVPLSVLNDVRRQAVEELEKARLAPRSREKKTIQPLQVLDGKPRKAAAKPMGKTELSVTVDSLEKVRIAAKAGADWIVFGGECFEPSSREEQDYAQAVYEAKKYQKKIILATPRILQPHQMSYLAKTFQDLNKWQPDAVCVGNIGMLEWARNMTDIPLHGDYSCNIYNQFALLEWQEQGLQSAALSPELTFAQIETLASGSPIPLECLVHGHITLMVSEFCLPGSYVGKKRGGICEKPCRKETYALRDRKNEKFPLVMDQFCRMHVLNGKELNMMEHVQTFMRHGIARIRVEGKYASSAALEKTLSTYRELLDDNGNTSFVKGNREQEENITRGHYFRGVL